MQNIDYLNLLNHSFEVIQSYSEVGIESRLEYLSEYIFDFTTYDSEMSELFATKALEICAAINSKTTFEYIKNQENYKWYLLMCNIQFFADKIEWGTSIRGAWWCEPYGNTIELNSCGLWINDEQINGLKFDYEEWEIFVAALIVFAKTETEEQK